MSVIKTSTNTVVATVGVGSGPDGVAITPNGSDAYVTNSTSGTVSVIKTSTNTVVATVGVRRGPDAVAITPNGSDAYVTNSTSANVSVIKTSTNTVVATVGVGRGPDGVAITPNGIDAYVANHDSADVSVVKISTQPGGSVGNGPSMGSLPLPSGSTPVTHSSGRERHQDLHQYGGEDHYRRQVPRRGCHHLSSLSVRGSSRHLMESSCLTREVEVEANAHDRHGHFNGGHGQSRVRSN